jgi:hypothetical protein
MTNSETDCVNIDDLPRDLIVSVLSFSDAASIHRFCATSHYHHRFMDLVGLWHKRAGEIWPHEAASPDNLKKPGSYWRSLLFKRSRIRFDGGYVSRCVYTRRIQEGASLTDTRTCLQVVYHRIIRFRPDHTALMLISEKGAKGYARQVFNELSNSDLDPSILDKYGKQLHRCRWKVINETKEGAMILLSYFDGKLCWSADLLAWSGNDKRHGGTRLEWYDYRFWDPTEVADHRRRDVYRERENLGFRLRHATIDRSTIDTLSDLLFQYERLGDILRSIRESHDDSIESIPVPLLRQITLCQEHFPIARFVHSGTLAHLF